MKFAIISSGLIFSVVVTHCFGRSDVNKTRLKNSEIIIVQNRAKAYFDNRSSLELEKEGRRFLTNVKIFRIKQKFYKGKEDPPTKGLQNKSVNPHEKHLAQFAIQLWRTFGWKTLKWVHYGNFCGFNGNEVGGRDHQNKPIDECDKCCQRHDECWENIKDCNPYTKWYDYQVGSSSRNCLDDPASCSFKVCSCDFAMVECMKVVSKVRKIC